jgi:hypothetical protein
MTNLITQLKSRPDISHTAWIIQLAGEHSPAVVERFQDDRVFCWTCCQDDCQHVTEISKIHNAQS